MIYTFSLGFSVFTTKLMGVRIYWYFTVHTSAKFLVYPICNDKEEDEAEACSSPEQDPIGAEAVSIEAPEGGTLS